MDTNQQANGFRGAFTALLTPFRDGKVDEEAFRRLIEQQIEQGIHGLVPCGTTGESATLSHAEHEAVIRICVEQTRGRVPVVAGAGSNNTSEAIALTRFAQSVGADGVLHITPYYNKPTQEGLYRHFKAIAEAVEIPCILYNVPGRTSCNMLPETVARLAREFPNIVGIKEATGDMAQGAKVIELCPESFRVLSGDDLTDFPLFALGGCGVISVTANIAPGAVASMWNAWTAGNVEEARRIHYRLLPLHRAMFMETNPIPVKTAAAMLGLMPLELRLPLVEMAPANRDKLAETLKAGGCLK